MVARTTRAVLTHVGAWAAFIFYEVFIVLVISSPQTIWWEYTGYYFLNIGLFYLHAHGVLANTFGKRHLPYLLLLLVPLELGLYTVLEYGLQYGYNLLRPEPRGIAFDLKTVLAYIWRGIYFIGLSTAYWFVGRTIRSQRQINQLEVQRLQDEKRQTELERNLARAQNSFLQAQINPHLLFNTLNFIYNAVQDTSPKASEGVMLLSEVMHHALGPVDGDGMTALENEVEHIQKYVALNQLRFRQPLQLSTQYSGSTGRHRIPPLLLLTFVENTFKHGDLTDPEHPASVSVCCRPDQIHFRVRNKKRRQAVKGGYGIGIQNAKTRLRDFYRAEACHLDIREDDLHYAVDLKINAT
jgi:two-component system, LytTR family, sensor kinase